MKTVKKVTDILKFLAREPDKPSSLGQICGELGINNSTGALLLKSMVENGLVDQDAPRKGYRLGPLPFFLTRNGPYRKDLVEAAAPLIQKLVEQTGETALLAALRHGRKLLLSVIEGNQPVQIRSENLYADDLATTATGRLLLSFLASEAPETFSRLDESIFTGWPEAEKPDTREREFKKIRNQGHVILEVKEMQYTQLACPIRQESAVVAAMGIPMPTYRYLEDGKIISKMKKTAEQISKSLG